LKDSNIIKDKSYSFSIRIVKLYQYLLAEKNEYVLGKQVLRSGTAICALVRESEFAQSKKDFIHKLHIALKEASETEYWLSLLHDTCYINKSMFISIQPEIEEIIKILISIIKTAKKSLH
jgi:four helix bundle protein